MKKHLVFYCLLLVLGVASSCKGKSTNQNNENITITEPATTAPVVVNDDQELRRGVKDATKDFPDVNATVNNGVITLDGSIERSQYPTLKQSLDGLRPRQVVNNLNYK